MTDPVSFVSATPRLGLPLLFAAQAQKEFFLNEALSRLDALLHGVVEGEADSPPVDPAAGECWIVGPAPAGEWQGHAGELALHQAGVWLFSPPIEGMRLYERSSGQYLVFAPGIVRAAPVPAPSGGTTQDNEARSAIAGLIAALELQGILPAS